MYNFRGGISGLILQGLSPTINTGFGDEVFVADSPLVSDIIEAPDEVEMFVFCVTGCLVRSMVEERLVHRSSSTTASDSLDNIPGLKF